MKQIIFATALGLATPLAAEPLMLETSLAGGTVTAGAVSMSAYWEPAENGYDLTAFVTTEGAEAEPQRLFMTLQDGDSVSFGVPGVRGILLNFERSADAVSISAAQVGRTYALAE